jgi:ketosteroid isomerase-like protein
MSTPLDLLRRHLAAADAGDFDADEALFDHDVQTVTPGGTLHGWKEFRAMNETLLTAATQPHHEIVRSFTNGDTAIIEGVFTTRHTGPMPTPDGQIPPTGNTVSFPFSCFFRVRDGRCVSYRTRPARNHVARRDGR